MTDTRDVDPTRSWPRLYRGVGCGALVLGGALLVESMLGVMREPTRVEQALAVANVMLWFGWPLLQLALERSLPRLATVLRLVAVPLALASSWAVVGVALLHSLTTGATVAIAWLGAVGFCAFTIGNVGHLKHLRRTLRRAGPTSAALVLIAGVADAAGLAIAHAGELRPHVVGAGHPLGAGGEDFAWMDAWQVHSGRLGQGADPAPPPELRGDALLVQKLEAASAIVYWDGSSYRWYQQGD